MPTFYVDRAGIELRAAGKALAIYENGGLQATIPATLLDRVVISAPTRFSSSLLAWLARHGVGVVVLGRGGADAAACVLGRPLGDGARRVAQYRAFLSEDWRRRWSYRLLRLKFAAQMRTLRRLMRERFDQRKPLRDALDQLIVLRDRLTQEQSRAALMGLEGAAAAAYFDGLAGSFPPVLGFAGRNRRPPRDPVNAVLSLAYTLVHYDAVHQIQAAGLDPFLGFFHALSWNRESLACDLIEPLRPRCDEWTWELFHRRMLRPEHFRRIRGACLLGKAGRRIFYQAQEALGVRMRRWLRRVCRLTVRALSQEFPVEEEASP